MTLLNVRGLSKAYGPRTLFSDASFTIEHGDKIGIIGVNGSGKSTLMRIIAGLEVKDDGDIIKHRDTTIAYLAQNPDFPPDATPRVIVAQALDALQNAIQEWNEVTEKLATATDKALEDLLNQQASLHRFIERRGGWAWEHRIGDILTRLELNDIADSPVEHLSGGQIRRVTLARLLLQQPDLMLLDEPTNHLDIETVEWLENTLKSWQGALMFITHDRYFLDRIAEHILEFDELTSEVFLHPGNYQDFMERRVERMRRREVAEKRRTRLLKVELEWLRRGPKARGTKAQARIDRAHGLMKKGAEFREKSIEMAFQTDKRLGGNILDMENISMGYGNVTLFRDVDLIVSREDRLGLIGPNGSGKSTFIRLLLGEESPQSGLIRWGRNSHIGYIDQHRTGLDPKLSVYEALHPSDTVTVNGRDIHKRSYLQEFLFERGEQEKRISSLSGGERCRLLLAQLILKGANFLILDEPTNDLDIQSLQVLESALAEFNGCVLLITHDRAVLNRVCTAILAIEDETITRYEGDYDFYRRCLLEQRQREQEREKHAAEVHAKKTSPTPEEAKEKTPVEKAPTRKKLSWREERELEGMEENILKLEDEKESLEASLQDPALYRENPAKVQTLTTQLDTLTKTIEDLYTRWQELEERSEL